MINQTQLEEGDVVLCTVDRIVGTIVFVKIDETGEEGSIITAEIAPGRIRNLRDYVIPKKKIVCKVLRISSEGNIHLSLRRVTKKEQKEVLNEYKLEKSYKGVLKGILGEKSTEELINKIQEKSKLSEFVEEIKENPKTLEELVGKEKSKKILEILKKQKTKKLIIKKQITLKTKSPNGIQEIKEIFSQIKNAEIKYISAGKYTIKVESSDLKKADQELTNILKDIEEKTKKSNIEFEFK